MTSVPESVLNKQQRDLVNDIASGRIKSFSDWFVIHYCGSQYPSQYPRAQTTPLLSDQHHSHINLACFGRVDGYYLLDRMRVADVRKEIFQFVALLVMLEEEGLIIQVEPDQIDQIIRGPMLSGNADIYDDPETRLAIDSALAVLGVQNPAAVPGFIRKEIVALPFIRTFISNDYTTVRQRQHHQLTDANARADKANFRSTIIAGIALVGTILSVLFQALGTTEVRITESYPRVTNTPVLHQPKH